MTKILFKAAAAALVLGCAATVWALAPVVAPQPAAQPKAPPAPAVAPAADAKPAADRVADAKQRVRSLNNLKQLMLAFHNYHDAYGHFPQDVRDADGKPLLSWRVAILPYLEQEDLYKQFKLDEPWDSKANKPLLEKMPDLFRAGFEKADATDTFYQGFAGPGAVFEPGKKLPFTDVFDGASNTVAVAEVGPAVPWTKPADVAVDPKKDFPKRAGPFKNVVLVGMLDGSTRALKGDLTGDTWRDLVVGNDGAVVDFDRITAVSKAETKEEREEAARLIGENAALTRKLAGLFAERDKLLAGRAKAGEEVPSPDRLAAEQERLRHLLVDLERAVEELKKPAPKK